MDTKIIKIKWNNQDRDVEIKRLTFGEMNDIQEQAIKSKIVGTSVQAVISQKTLKEVSLLKGIKTAPFEVDIQTIQGIPADLGNRLFEEINRYNNISLEKKDDLNGPSGKGQQTQK